MLPREHGAYGQLLFPLVTPLAAGRPGLAALLLTMTAVCAFLAHEPLLVLAGRRGARSAREDRTRALRWFTMFAVPATCCGLIAIAFAAPSVRIALVAPALLAVIVVALIVTDDLVQRGAAASAHEDVVGQTKPPLRRRAARGIDAAGGGVRVKRARMLVGAAALVGGLALYALAAVELAGRVVPEHWAAQALFYAVAGVLWFAPAARLTRWMQSAPRDGAR